MVVVSGFVVVVVGFAIWLPVVVVLDVVVVVKVVVVLCVVVSVVVANVVAYITLVVVYITLVVGEFKGSTEVVKTGIVLVVVNVELTVEVKLICVVPSHSHMPSLVPENSKSHPSCGALMLHCSSSMSSHALLQPNPCSAQKPLHVPP